METRDLYKTLGVSREASQEEIRRAYPQPPRNHHSVAHPPDDTAEGSFKVR